MAKIGDMTIYMRKKLRPCTVDGVPALFHHWVDDSEFGQYILAEKCVALVEYEDGTTAYANRQMLYRDYP